MCEDTTHPQPQRRTAPFLPMPERQGTPGAVFELNQVEQISAVSVLRVLHRMDLLNLPQNGIVALTGIS